MQIIMLTTKQGGEMSDIGIRIIATIIAAAAGIAAGIVAGAITFSVCQVYINGMTWAEVWVELQKM